jgi:hypothetical protein
MSYPWIIWISAKPKISKIFILPLWIVNLPLSIVWFSHIVQLFFIWYCRLFSYGMKMPRGDPTFNVPDCRWNSRRIKLINMINKSSCIWDPRYFQLLSYVYQFIKLLYPLLEFLKIFKRIRNYLLYVKIFAVCFFICRNVPDTQLHFPNLFITI